MRQNALKEEESTLDDSATPLPSVPMAQHIGKLFEQARGELNLSIKTIADKIHVRTLYLEAIEKGEFDRLPSALYAAGFIRLYARHLHLDGDEILRRLDLARENPLAHSTLIHAKPSIEPNRFVIFTSLILSLISLGLVFFVFWGQGTEPLIERDIHAPESFLHSPLTPSTARDNGGEDAHAEADESRLEGGPILDHEEDLLHPLPDLMNEENASGEPSSASENELILFAHGDCWMEIRTPEKILFSGILKAGKSYSVDHYNDVTLSVGNAPVLDIRHGKTILPPLSKAHSVVKNVPLADYVVEHTSQKTLP